MMGKYEKREDGGRDKISRSQHSPHALQMLFPASSRRQRGVVLVPQFAQASAPTAPRPRGILLPSAEFPSGVERVWARGE